MSTSAPLKARRSRDPPARELEHEQRQTAQENERVKAENDDMKNIYRERSIDIALPDFSSFTSTSVVSPPSSSLAPPFFPSPAAPTTSLPSTSSDNNLLSVDFRPRSGLSSYPVGHATQKRARSMSDPYLLHPHAHPAFVGKGVTIPSRGNGTGNVDVDTNNNDGGFIAYTRTHSAPDMRTHLAPTLQITTANDDGSDGFTASGYSSYGYDTPSPASSVSVYDLPPQSPYPTTPHSPFLSAPASPYIQDHGPTMTSSAFDTPSSPVKNSMMYDHSPFKSEVDLHPSPFLPTFVGSSNSSPSLYDHHNFTFTPNAANTNESMLLGRSGSLFGAEDRDEMKVEM